LEPTFRTSRIRFGRISAVSPKSIVVFDSVTLTSKRHGLIHWVSLDAILEHNHERRLWQRFPVRENRVKLTWFEDGSEKTVRGELSNISGGGAAIIADVDSPANELI
jgi:hypothetical protein